MPRKQKALLDDGVVMRDQIAAIPLPLTDLQIQQLAQYMTLLLQWNQVFNLTAIREPSVAVQKHLWDSLMVASHLEGSYFLDVGSGAGLPGIPLAIYFPNAHFHLVDCVEKKVLFLRLVAHQCRLKNVEVTHARIEDLVTPPPSGVLFRAFASLKKILDLYRKKSNWVDSTLYLWKAQRLDQELFEIAKEIVDLRSERVDFEEQTQYGVRSLLKLKKR